MSNAVQKDVENLVEKELKSANEKFPMFHSAHEGYAVILEEFEETQCELENLNNATCDLWERVKDNATPERLNLHARAIKKYSINLACEAIQVAAMAQKFVDSLEVKNDKG